MSFDPMYMVEDVAVSPDGLVYVAAPVGVAWRDGAGEWTLIDVEGLPTGAGLEDRVLGRFITQVAAGPDGVLWVTGFAMSHADDEQFGGTIDGWSGGSRILWWVAQEHCPVCGEWAVWTTNGVPELAGDIGDLVVAGDGAVYVSVGSELLMMFDGKGWTSIEVPLPPSGGVTSPWSSSLAVGNDGAVWAGSHNDNGGVLRFDGTGFIRYTTDDGLPEAVKRRWVSAAGDGTIWAATEKSGIARFDGTSWVSYTTADGLLSNQAVVAAGADGTVWAVHNEGPPYGYSRFDGSGWTTFPFDSEVGGYRAEVAPDGTLWTVSEEGLISFDGVTRTVHPSPFPHPVSISAVRLGGDEFFTRQTEGDMRQGEGMVVAVDTIVDGVFLPEGQQWDEGAVWWEEDLLNYEPRWIELDLDGPQQLLGAMVQADDNDSYLLSYRNLETDGWVVLWRVPPVYNFGMQTRSVTFATPVTTDTLRFEAESGDDMYSVSEIVVFGPPAKKVGFLTFTPVRWGISLDDGGPGVHTVFMEVDVHPANLAEGVSGRLIWDETAVDLCGIGIELAGVGLLHIGDTFQTTEGCGSSPSAMQDAFDEYGLPEQGCVTVTVDDLDHDYCAPLPGAGDVSVGSQPGTVMVSLEGLEGFAGLDVHAWVVETDPTGVWQRLGVTSFTFIDADPYSASQVMQTPDGFDQGEVATFEPGTYRFIIEAQYPSGNMYYGCEMPIQVIGSEPLIVTLSSIPTYTDSGINWTPLDELAYPDCPN